MNVWRFSHLSMAEYFENNQWSLQAADCYVAKFCLRYLIEAYRERAGYFTLTHESSRSITITSISDLSLMLLHYLACFWMDYALQTQEKKETDLELIGMLKTFIGSPRETSMQYQRWHEDLFDAPMPRSLDKYYHDHSCLEAVSPANCGILGMCRFGFYALLQDWWDGEDLPLSQISMAKTNLLQNAMDAGSKPICEILIKRGIERSLPGSTGRALVDAVLFWGY